jgi:hypothetical protein
MVVRVDLEEKLKRATPATAETIAPVIQPLTEVV